MAQARPFALAWPCRVPCRLRGAKAHGREDSMPRPAAWKVKAEMPTSEGNCSNGRLKVQWHCPKKHDTSMPTARVLPCSSQLVRDLLSLGSGADGIRIPILFIFGGHRVSSGAMTVSGARCVQVTHSSLSVTHTGAIFKVEPSSSFDFNVGAGEPMPSADHCRPISSYFPNSTH